MSLRGSNEVVSRIDTRICTQKVKSMLGWRGLHSLHIAKLRKTSLNGSLPGFSALLVMTFYLVLVTNNVHSTSRLSCSDLLCDIFNTG